jgi:catechol 2,3-dioxygenase-like lactoylglutathione lyase family enzyme
VIIGMHAIVYSKEADRTRTFFRDVLGLRSVDAGRGWLIFALPPAELAAHPDDTGGRHELYLMCDDVEKTMAELSSKGVEFTKPVADRGWGLLTAMKVPGAGEIWLYQPKHPMAIGPSPGKSKAARRVRRGVSKKPPRRAKRSRR